MTTTLTEDYMMNRFKSELGPNDRFLFYFSGHGTDLGGNVGYMQFSKAKPGVYESDQHEQVTRASEWSSVLPVKHALFIFDSCVSGYGWTPKGDRENATQALLKTLSGNGSRVVITAGTAKDQAYQIEVSKQNGYSIFTDEFIEALRTTPAYGQRGSLQFEKHSTTQALESQSLPRRKG